MAKRPILLVCEHLLFTFLAIFNGFRLASAVSVGVPPENVTSTMSNEYYCTNNAKWRGTGSSIQDCNEAVKLLYDVEVTYFGAKNFDFLSVKARPRVQDWMRTPRKYTIGESFSCHKLRNHLLRQRLMMEGKCTLAIVMLNFFPNGKLPGIEKGTAFPSRDQASFLDVYVAALKLQRVCSETRSQPGWAPVGE